MDLYINIPELPIQFLSTTSVTYNDKNFNTLLFLEEKKLLEQSINIYKCANIFPKFNPVIPNSEKLLQ